MQGSESTSDIPDHELVNLVLQNHQDAFEELVRRYYPRCVDVATILLHNRWDAEDQVQIAFSKVHRRLYQYSGRAKLATWLTQIVRNQCLMLMRERRRARFVRLDEWLPKADTPAIDLPAYGSDPEGEVAFDELKEVLRAEIRRVPPVMRTVIRLRDIEGLSMGKIADVLHISIPAVKSRLSRARAELRSRLKCRCGSIGPFSALSTSAASFDRVAYHTATQAEFALAKGPIVR